VTTLDKVQLLEQRIIKAALLIRKLENRIVELEEEVSVLTVHNTELQNYADSYSADQKIIEESVTKALDTLGSIEGLDEIDLMGTMAEDLAVADQFTAGGGVAIDEVTLDDLNP
jgi:regulator of replication initiation timing